MKLKKARKVAMTTPVFVEPEGNDNIGQMGFVVPEKVAAEHIPNPTDETVQLQKQKGSQFAVRRFAGQTNEESMAENEEELRKWIVARGLSDSEGLEFAGYDPPWTPNPFRRNEVLIPLK